MLHSCVGTGANSYEGCQALLTLVSQVEILHLKVFLLATRTSDFSNLFTDSAKIETKCMESNDRFQSGHFIETG